jgi:hypothetical protein
MQLLFGKEHGTARVGEQKGIQHELFLDFMIALIETAAGPTKSAELAPSRGLKKTLLHTVPF